jgi:hypothetical protein
MRWKSHVRFGKRAGETDQLRDWHRAPARLHSRVRLPVIVVVLLMIISLLCSWLRSLRTTPLRRSMNGDDYR